MQEHGDQGGVWEKRTEILDEELLRARDVGVIEHLGVAVLERLARRRVEQADAVVVREAGLPRNDGLDGVDVRVRRDLDGLGEAPDGLPGGCRWFSLAELLVVNWFSGERDVQRFLSLRVTAAILTSCVVARKLLGVSRASSVSGNFWG